MATSQPEESIFHAALRLDEPDQRAAYLDEICGDDQPLRQRIDALLAADQAGDYLEPSASHLAATALLPPIGERPGDRIGPYKLLEQIGEGGMGLVFVAEQSQPLRRRVALKVIKPGLDTRAVIARFEAERQALALMDHPNIARVYDAGATDSGRPYFVMELVQGVPITEYCDQSNLPTRERLELFITVCQAVQHAHQKGIIHRDLKPTNVLVAMQDGKPAPKVIDFGVAKAIGEQTLTERTLTTAFAQMVGTPMYMSPEQAELSPLGVDTRSDIYSLGVMLYELLAGSTPFDKDRLHAASYDELRRIIREEEPPRPSTRLSSLSLREREQMSTGDPKSPERSAVAGREAMGVRETAALATTIAENRRTDPRRLIQTVCGELDWIVMKCLEKDRNRRYDSAGSLARDVERYLLDEPVQACPPSAAYRLKKFVRRNKVAAFVGGCLVAAVAALAVSNFVIRSALSQKNAALALALANEQQAAKEFRRAQATADFWSSVLGSSYPDQVKDSQYTLRQLLDDIAAQLGGALDDQPEVKAAIHSMLGRSYWRLGVFERADLHLKIAVDLHKTTFGAVDKHVADALVDYAWNLGEVGRIAEAEACARKAATIYEGLEPTAQDTAKLANALYITAIAQLRQGDAAGYRATCETLVNLDVHHEDIVLTSRPIWPLCLAPNALVDMNRLVTRAEKFFTENSRQDRFFALYVLGAALYRNGDYDQAAQRLEESINAYSTLPPSGRDNINYARLLLTLAKWKQGRKGEAHKLFVQTRIAVADELQAPSIRWNRRTSLELLCHEAEALIGPVKVDEAGESELEP
jgi:serine/threonine protein kinase